MQQQVVGKDTGRYHHIVLLAAQVNIPLTGRVPACLSALDTQCNLHHQWGGALHPGHRVPWCAQAAPCLLMQEPEAGMRQYLTLHASGTASQPAARSLQLIARGQVLAVCCHFSMTGMVPPSQACRVAGPLNHTPGGDLAAARHHSGSVQSLLC